MVSKDRGQKQSKQGANPVVYPQQQSSRTSNTNSLLQWRSHRTYEQSQIPRDPFWLHADVHDAGRINKTQVEERTVHTESHGCKRHWTTSPAPALPESDTQRHWQLWHSPISCSIFWNCHRWKQDLRCSKSKCIFVRCRIPRIRSTMLSQKKRGVDWHEKSHGQAK